MRSALPEAAVGQPVVPLTSRLRSLAPTPITAVSILPRTIPDSLYDHRDPLTAHGARTLTGPSSWLRQTTYLACTPPRG